MKTTFSITLVLLLLIVPNAFTQSIIWMRSEKENFRLERPFQLSTKFNDLSRVSTKLTYQGEKFAIEEDFEGALFPSKESFRGAKFGVASFKSVSFVSEADFEGTKFVGIADLSYAEFESAASFQNAKFYSTAYFWETEFDSWAVFSHAKFSEVSFWKARFASMADFQNAEFISTAEFWEAQFDSTAFFRGAEFKSEVYFYGVNFSLSPDFWKTKFNSTVYFYKTVFDSAYFHETVFDSTAIFWQAKFNSETDFTNAIFASMVDFRWAKLGDTLLFSGAQFHGETLFDAGILPKFIDFSQVTRITHEIDLTKSIINPDYDTCFINLTDAAIDKFRFRYKRFKLWFPKQDSLGFELKSTIYQNLLTKQKENNFTQSYEILDKEYREFQYTDPRAKRGLQGKILNWVEKNWWGYGYNKERIIWNSLIIFLILSVINSFFLKYLITQVYANDKIKKLIDMRENKNKAIKWFDSLRYSIFYTAIIFFSFNFDMDKLNYAGNLYGWRILNLTYFMVIYLGGVVCMAYLANFIITI